MSNLNLLNFTILHFIKNSIQYFEEKGKKKIMKKVLFIFVALLALFYTRAFADPIVELAAPRIAPKVMTEDNSALKQKTTIESKGEVKLKVKAGTKKTTPKRHKKKVFKKPIEINYNKVSQLIEYGYYDDADKLINNALKANSKDIKAKTLRTVSLAKQTKLDPAQSELLVLLKKYPNISDLHFAQGIVYYKRTTSSNLFYRNNSAELFSNSLKEFQTAITLDKTNAKAYNAAGVVQLNLGKTKEAKDYFTKALGADKTYSTALDNLGTMDYLDGKYNDAEKKYKQALEYNTQNTTAMYHLAQINIQKADYTTALKYLNNALAINSNSPAIYNLMGKAYNAQGNEAAAINSFKKSLAVKPEFTLSYLDLADVYEKRGDSELAIEQLKTAVAIDPTYNEAKLKIADISFLSGNYLQAIAFYSELVGTDEFNSTALKGLANAYYGQAQIAAGKAVFGSNQDLYKALDCVNKAISANNNDLELHLSKLKLSKITNQAELSQINLNKIIQATPVDLISTIIKGEAYLSLSDLGNAQKTFDSAINMSKTTQDDLDLSEIFIFHKQYDSAEKVLQKILKNDAQNQEALSNLDYIQKCKKHAKNYSKTGKSFVKSKNISAATDYLSRSLSINPNNPEDQLLLAQLYEKQKQYQDSLSSYKMYLGLVPNSPYAKDVQKKINGMENRL